MISVLRSTFLHYSGTYRATRWIFGGKCPEDNIGFLVPVPNRTRATLEPLIIRNIQPGSMIHHDCWASYDGRVKFEFVLEELRLSFYVQH